MRILEYQQTPNPHALKCVLDGVLPPAREGAPTPRSFASGQDASSDPVAEALLRVAGVRNVLLSGGWLTIGKSPEADWRAVKREVEKVLAPVQPAAPV